MYLNQGLKQIEITQWSPANLSYYHNKPLSYDNEMMI